jgi:hypothetical protein
MNKKREASLTEIREIDPQAAKKEQKRPLLGKAAFPILVF